MFVVKLPPETKNTKLSFAHFAGHSFGRHKLAEGDASKNKCSVKERLY
jgi:hypothetical protein